MAELGREIRSTHRLAEFLALISGLEDRREVARTGVRRVAEALGADAVALVAGTRTLAAVGIASTGADEVVALTAELVERPRLVTIPGLGPCEAVALAAGDPQTRLLVARSRGRLDDDELDLGRGMGRVLGLALRSAAIGGEGPTADTGSDRAAARRESEERAELLDQLRDRQTLVEQLSDLQRAIVDNRPLHEVLEGIVEGARRLLRDDVAVLRRRTSIGTDVLASAGADEAASRRQTGPMRSVGATAIAEADVAVADARGGDRGLAEAEFATPEISCAIACPVAERGSVVASLATGSRDPDRLYEARDHQILLAFGELASLALNHAAALSDALHEAFHDRLTSLPNRALFSDRLEHALALAKRSGHLVGVLFCDLDRFKNVNDSLGHAAGDQLLASVGARLRHTLRPADTVARIGGDEFAILLDEIDDPEDAARAAKRVLDAFETPFEVGGRELFVGASIGIATGRDDAQAMVRDADLAMYRAKSAGKGRYAVYEPDLHRAIVERLELEVDLKGAIERDELELVYQPVFDLRSGAIGGLEALVRWRHPRRGSIPPEDFIPLAEENGEIHRLGRWVLREACRQAALWRARYPGFPGLSIGVNVSGVQILDGSVVDEVTAALDASQLEASGLTLELTETVLLSDVDLVAERLAALKAIGVDLAIDDFGRGYSSLLYLHRFPIDDLKIDREFVASARGEEDPQLLRAMLEIAQVFSLQPIAEGIETPEEAERLIELGCELGQGHLLSGPVSAAQADALLLEVGLLGAPPSGGRLGSARDEALQGPEGDPRGGAPRGGDPGAGRES